MASSGGRSVSMMLGRLCYRIPIAKQSINQCINCTIRVRCKATSVQPLSSKSVTGSLVHPSSPTRPCTRLSHSEGVATETVDPYVVMQPYLSQVYGNIRDCLRGSNPAVEEMAAYHFDGQGKAFRPLVVLLSAKACNQHTLKNEGEIMPSQARISEIAEMIHVASLIHDDVIDGAHVRRGLPSVHASWGQRQAILSGVYIISVSSMQLARLRNERVVEVLSQVLEDLVTGEFMQLGSEENENERFSHYLQKTFKKTASLIANSCKAVSIISGASEEVQEAMYQYGRHVGMAFQLVDDLLDFTSTEDLMGKPAAADLKLGLATAPLLFAAQEHPELNALIMRRFTQTGDVDFAWNCVRKSDGLAQTRLLAEQHCKEAIRQVSVLQDSNEKKALAVLTDTVLNRMK